MSNKYIKCDCCGGRIYFGAPIYYMDDYYGVYCSAKCFTYAYSDGDILTEKHAKNRMCKIYDDEERKAEIKAQIERLQRELEELK